MILSKILVISSLIVNSSIWQEKPWFLEKISRYRRLILVWIYFEFKAVNNTFIFYFLICFRSILHKNPEAILLWYFAPLLASSLTESHTFCPCPQWLCTSHSRS